jgi:hypothetical protein
VSSRTGSRLIVASDSLAAERALTDELSRLADAEPLARKVVVVPSHSLRIALLARLASVRPAWLGLEIVTLRGLARSVLQRAGRSHHSGDLLLPVVVERLARRERALAKHLETLVDGFAGAQGAVRDLLDAGFGEQHLEPALERLEEERPVLGGEALDRAAALCRIAAAARGELAALGLAVDADLYASAADCLSIDPERALPAAAVLIHGFADATGVASDLLDLLVRLRPTAVVLLDPWELDGTSRAVWRFGRRLAERFEGFLPSEHFDAPPDPARLTLYSAADPARETQAAVGLVAERIAAGERPEEIAIVSRDPALTRALLAREIDRQALPASGSVGPASPLARRARGLLELLDRRGDAALSLAFAVAGELLSKGTGARPWEIRLGALSRGARRLAALAEIEVTESRLLLPIRDRFSARPAEPEPLGEEGSAAAASTTLRAAARPLAGAALRLARRRAKELLGRLESLSRRQPLASALGAVADLVRAVVDSAEDQRGLLDPLAALAEAADFVPRTFEVTAAELVLLLSEAWSALDTSALGGSGGGVPLLSVTEARGRTFRRIVVAGLTRDCFPRAVRADPFLPDSLRTRLRDLLPDLPVKSEGHDEERFLFAQLLGAAPEIDLITARADEEGKALSPSSFLDELRRIGRISGALEAPAPAVQSALDLACRTALADERALFAPALARAFSEGATPGAVRFAAGSIPANTGADAPAEAPTADLAPRWAASHVALLAELAADPFDVRIDRLGPFFGFVGEARPSNAAAGGAADPRTAAPPVTTLQEVAGCGWRALLGTLLRLGSLPAGEDEIPALPSYLAGTVAHAVLEEMAPTSLRAVGSLAAAGLSVGAAVAWPKAAELEAAISHATRSVLTTEGFDPDLFALPIELAAAEALAVVRRLDWASGSRHLLAIEADGWAALSLPRGERRVRFRADRVEREGGALLLTDYKTGNSVVSSAVKASTRQDHLEQSLAQGKWLQLAAYARAAASLPVEGRLLFLKADLEDDRREVRRISPPPGSATDETDRWLWQSLFSAWEEGAFLPRLLAPDLQSPYEGCAYCDVRVACLQGDSGARLRLANWVLARRGGAARERESRPEAALTDPIAAAVESAWQLFRLREPADGTDGESA